MVWLLTIFILLAPGQVKVVQVELTSPKHCQGAAQKVAKTAARRGALDFKVVGCEFVAQQI